MWYLIVSIPDHCTFSYFHLGQIFFISLFTGIVFRFRVGSEKKSSESDQLILDFFSTFQEIAVGGFVIQLIKIWPKKLSLILHDYALFLTYISMETFTMVFIISISLP